MKPIEKEGLEALESEPRAFSINLKAFNKEVRPRMDGYIFRTDAHLCGIVIQDCYYAYGGIQPVDIEFCKANNLEMVHNIPDYIQNLMSSYASRTCQS